MSAFRLRNDCLDYLGVPRDNDAPVDDATYKTVLSEWCESGFLRHYDTNKRWRYKVIKEIRSNHEWKKRMFGARRGRPPRGNREAIENAIILAKNDPLRFLSNHGISLKETLSVVEEGRSLYEWASCVDRICRSKIHRQKIFTALEFARSSFAEADKFVRLMLNSPYIEEGLKRRNLMPPPPSDWFNFVAEIIKGIDGSRAGGPKKREHLEYLQYRLLYLTKAAIKSTAFKKDMLRYESWRDWIGDDDAPHDGCDEESLDMFRAPIFTIATVALAR